MAGILYKKGSDKLESLNDITPKGKKLLFCQAHLLLQGKDDESILLTSKTAEWVQENVKIPGTSAKHVMKMISHYKSFRVDPEISPIIKQFSNSDSGKLDSLDQLTTEGKKFFYSWVHLVKQGGNPNSFKSRFTTYRWLLDNFEHGEKITDIENTVLKKALNLCM